MKQQQAALSAIDFAFIQNSRAAILNDQLVD